jgi:hypothetical protein
VLSHRAGRPVAATVILAAVWLGCLGCTGEPVATSTTSPPADISPGPAASSPRPAASSPGPTGTAPAPVRGSDRSTAPPTCESRSRGRFAPVTVDAPGLGAFKVQSLPRVRDASGAIASAGPTDKNPSVFAWDNESAKVGTKGNVLLTAHTYRTGKSALGNRLLSELRAGEILRIGGAGHEVACYRVVERLEVAVEDYPVDRVYLDDSARQAVITVCSDFDGNAWAKRTLWFLEPVA